MLTKEQITERLSDRIATVVAERTGLTVMTVSNVKNSKGSPSYKTLAALSEYLDKYP